MVLGLPRQASNNAVLGECGRYSLHVTYFRKCIKYWLRILHMHSSRYVKCCYFMLKTMDEKGKRTWVTNIKEILYKYGFGLVWMEQAVGNEALFLSEFISRLKDCQQQDWHRDIHNSSKLSIYCTFKSLLEAEKYLECINVWTFRQALAKLRCSCHPLEVERGRHNGILMENRLCQFCEQDGLNVIEDEYHFLLCCPMYSELREVTIGRQISNRPDFQSFISLMSSQDVSVIKKLATYIFHANNLRTSKLTHTYA